MPTPPKPFTVITGEKKSHRTKAELSQRKQGEQSLLSGTTIKPREEVKSNAIAQKEYRRVNALLKKIDKNDALYEPVINRYCMIQAECTELEKRREFYFELVVELRESFKEVGDDLPYEEKYDYIIQFTKELSKLTKEMMGIDRMLQQKRKMLFDIEKENVMTIASALRTVPKKVEKKKSALELALMDG